MIFGESPHKIMTAAIRGMGPIKTIAMGKLEVTKSNNIVMKDDDNLTVIADVRGQKPWYIFDPEARFNRVNNNICETIALPSSMCYLFYIAFGFC